MAAPVMAKPASTAPKMKKPPAPTVQTNVNGQKPSAPSSSPSSARKSLPGQNPTPTSATSNGATATSATRPNRRLQRLNTRNGTADAGPVDKRAVRKFPEPYVLKSSHILRKFKGCPPSLIIHLHPTHFRFDQQDGSFSYHSEMRVFMDHLVKGTIPHDMVEEFRKADVKYYDGWLIVKVIDHKCVANNTAMSGSDSDGDKPFSIHNYNQYITPSPYVPYPSKEQSVARSPPLKQDDKEVASSDAKDGLQSDDTIDVVPKASKPQPKIYHVGLRPTILSRHMDLVIDAMTPDPKSLNRNKSQANSNSRVTGPGAPSTPIAGMPTTPSAEKGPPFKKQKLRIDPKDMLEYEARVVNATAPPLYLEPVEDLEEATALLESMKDPLHDCRPPSPKSRKRTVAELAADDAHAKEQERFMLVMDERMSGVNGSANAAAVDSQAGATFQPRFEKFHALENIKRDLEERRENEKKRQMKEDEARRAQQAQLQEEEKKRIQAQRTQEARMRQRAREQEIQAAMVAQQQQQQQAAAQQALAQSQAGQRPPSQQVNGIPPNVQSQMMAPQRGSPVVRQGTPHAVSSPVVTSAAQGGHAMALSGSQQGHGSPARPGSALQHGHPAAPMARVPSGQEPSRNGTPQLPHGTPAMRNATPVIRQGTPAQLISQASPHGSMVAPTPQMMPSGMVSGMQGQVPNGAPRQLTPQQIAEIQRRQSMAQAAAMQQQMANGTQQMAQNQMAHLAAQQHAQAMQRQQQAAAMQQGTPQSQHMSPNLSQTQKAAYNQGVAELVKAQMQNLQGQNQGSPTPNQMAAQQLAHAQQQQRVFAAQQAQAQAQAQGQMMGGGVQVPQQRAIPPALQQLYQTTLTAYTQRLMSQMAAKYGGNMNMIQPVEMQQLQNQARGAAMAAVRKRQSDMAMQQAQMRQQGAQQQGTGMTNGMMGMNVNPNMQAMLQQQQAQQMQQIQMQQAQAQMQLAAQQQQHQNMQFQQQR